MWVERAFNSEFTTKTIPLKQFFPILPFLSQPHRIALEESRKTNFLFPLEFIYLKKKENSKLLTNILTSIIFFFFLDFSDIILQK